MRRARWSVLLAALSAAALCGAPQEGGASGQVAFASADRLRTWCLAGGAPRASCNGYLMGVADTLRHPAVASALAAGGAAVCLPPKLHGQQIRNLFLNHLHRHPERAAHAATDAVWSTLIEAFACPDQPRERPEPVPGQTSEPERIS